jgi:hypothetical protein
MKIYMKLGRKPPLPDLRVQRYSINRVIFSKKSSLTQRLQF